MIQDTRAALRDVQGSAAGWTALADVWRYRGFVLSSISRELTARYRGTLLGATWIVIHPLLMIAIYTLVFSQVMRTRLPGIAGNYAYSIYLCAGLLPWTYFAETVSRIVSVFVENANLIKKANFPRLCLPLVSVGVASVNFAIMFALFLAFLAAVGEFPGFALVQFLPALALQIVLAAGLGLFLATINVFFRDVGHVTQLALQLSFWLTPIVYPLAVLPPWVQGLLALNPMTGILGAYQGVFVYKAAPYATDLLPAVAAAIAAACLGWIFFRRREAEMADEL